MDYHNCYTVAGREFELKHHGIKGMKWGVRRYQNKDGTRTEAGKKRYRDMSDEEKSARNKKVAKYVAAALVMTASAGVAVAAYRKNPAKVNAILSKVGNKTVDGAKKAGKAFNAGKQYVKDAAAGTKEGFADIFKEATTGTKARYRAGVKTAYAGVKSGIKDGLKSAPKKATEVVITGATLLAAKRILDRTVGEAESERIFKANNKKKIDSFWKVNQRDRDDD